MTGLVVTLVIIVCAVLLVCADYSPGQTGTEFDAGTDVEATDG